MRTYPAERRGITVDSRVEDVRQRRMADFLRLSSAGTPFACLGFELQHVAAALVPDGSSLAQIGRRGSAPPTAYLLVRGRSWTCALHPIHGFEISNADWTMRWPRDP